MRHFAMLDNLGSESFQTQFHARWSDLHNPHVRALAWLITSPDLLDPAAAQWRGKIAHLIPPPDVDAWLAGLERDPAILLDALALRPFERLGRYAEKLLAFHFQQHGTLVAHGVQVRTDKNETVGEFDYLLRDGEALVHWELATKLYLLEGSRDSDYFVGPNLADTLGLKMSKILDRQLALGLHASAQVHLPEPIARAQALIKGWLFYHGDDQPAARLGLMPDHCRGFWCALEEARQLEADRFVVLTRLAWLAPLQVTLAQTLDKAGLRAALQAHFAVDSMPVVVALLRQDGGLAQETARGFVVPDDWRERAGQRAQRSFIAAAARPD
ncbi:hypothetical protein RCH09_001167 [Actimicrobium sp. GrIS 1.19]|nr:hypothetical protein [Actimicrobium sp. GrIS 1.19]